ncbi:hypothetical protein LCGC14_2309320, partial [marine sediment metagenome]
MTDKLTNDDIIQLRKPFQPHQHDFLRGFTYVKEYAVTERIEGIDPAWSFEIIDTRIDHNRQQVHVTARMTVRDSTRDGVGSADMQWMGKTKWENKKKVSVTDAQGNQIMIAANEAEKSAATDALKRCARMFGVGRYLTELRSNDNVGNVQELTRWLKQNFDVDANTPENEKHDEPPDTPANYTWT